MIDDIKQIVESKLNIPEIDLTGAVLDGSYQVTPYYVDGLHADGTVKTATVSYAINLFYVKREDALQCGIALWKALNDTHNIVTSTHDYTYQEEARIWMVTINIEEVNAI